MRAGSELLDPYVKEDVAAAKAKRMIDALSVLPAAGAVPGAMAFKKRGGLAVKKGRK
jgi:hypothetical protein